MIFQIEAKTRQWIGILIVSGFVIAMIWTGKIPVTVYQHWEGLLVGALFYHVIRMLNSPALAIVNSQVNQIPNPHLPTQETP